MQRGEVVGPGTTKPDAVSETNESSKKEEL